MNSFKTKFYKEVVADNEQITEIDLGLDGFKYR